MALKANPIRNFPEHNDDEEDCVLTQVMTDENRCGNSYLRGNSVIHHVQRTLAETALTLVTNCFISCGIHSLESLYELCLL